MSALRTLTRQWKIILAFAVIGLGPPSFLAWLLTRHEPEVVSSSRTVPIGSKVEALVLRSLTNTDMTIAGTSAQPFRVYWFWSAGCPCSQRADAELLRLRKAFPDTDFVAVASSPSDDLDTVREAARSRGLSVPVTHDPDGVACRALGAEATPTAVVLDREGRIVFRGPPDSAEEGPPPVEHYLETALRDLTTGKVSMLAPERPVTGCSLGRPR